MTFIWAKVLNRYGQFCLAFQSLINICCHVLHIRFFGNLVLTERKERNWPEKEPRHQSFASLATLTTAQVDPLTSTNYFWSSGSYIMCVILVHHRIIWACKKYTKSAQIRNKTSQNFALSTLKRTLAWKQYTTGSAGDADQYQLWSGLIEKLFSADNWWPLFAVND